jgi:nodulation protein E
MGAVTAIGQTCAEYWTALREGRSGIRPIESVDRTQLCARMGAEVPNFNLSGIPGKGLRAMDRFAQFAVAAAHEAVEDARIEWTPALRQRTAVVTGSCVGGQTTEDRAFRTIYGGIGHRVDPLAVFRIMANAGASHIAARFGIRGPAYSVSTACSSASHAIGQAYWMVRDGMSEMAVCGGSEAPFSLGHLRAWEAMRALSIDTCRPFCRRRRGIVLGEGGAMLVLEPLEAAIARGARIHAEVAGFCMLADPDAMVESSPDAAAAAMLGAVEDAELMPDAIGYINAHGTGTLANDAMESRAIHTAFGARAGRLPVSSTKSMHGHTLGAAGALEAIATALALRDGVLPPTANFLEPDPECDLDVIPNHARREQVEYALSNSFALGGLNAVLTFRRSVV